MQISRLPADSTLKTLGVKKEEDDIYKGPKLCRECLKCADACPVNAISPKNKITVKIGVRNFEFGRRDSLRCKWANSFGMAGEEGPN